jgi:hypothetical protein
MPYYHKGYVQISSNVIAILLSWRITVLYEVTMQKAA